MKRCLMSLVIAGILFCAAAGAQIGQGQKPKPHHILAGVECKDCHNTDKPVAKAEEPACLECHGSREDVAAGTEKLDPNPHFGHEEGLSCGSCHREHETSILFCDDCHQWGYTTP